MTHVPPRVSIIIINWNGRDNLHRCLQSLANQTFTDFEILVVDNGSDDGSTRLVRDEFPQVRLLEQSENLGFAKANNIAAAAARGRWIALLNNDAFPLPAWLEELVAAADTHPEYGSFASCLLRHGRAGIVDGAGDSYHVFGRPWRNGHNQPLAGQWMRPGAVFGPCAAAALYRRDVYLDLGGFDESFFCYLEDVDLAFRMNLAGWPCYYVPNAKVFHIGSATQGRHSAFTRYHGHRNLVWTFIKNMPGRLFWLYLPGHLALNFASLIGFALRGQATAVWHAKRDALRDLRRVLQQRREIQGTRRITPTEMKSRLRRGFIPLLSVGRHPKRKPV